MAFLGLGGLVHTAASSYPPSGAGEPASVATAPAIANAVFDATGARLRTVPFTPVRVKEALAHRA